MMKKKFFSATLFALLAMAAIAIAQDVPGIPGGNSAPPGPQPKIQIENPLYDFGAATEGTMVPHTFKIKNVGTGRLLIRGVKTSCGCTAAAPTKTNLAPGEDAQITAGFDTRFQKGHQVRTITVTTNDPDTPQAVMTLQGVVKQQVAALPDQVIFGKVKQGAEISKEVLVSDLTGKPNFSVGDISNTNPAIKVEKQNRPDGKPGAMLKITMLPSMPVGTFDDTVKVTTSRIPLNIDVSGTVTGDLSVDPAQVSFGIVPRGHDAIRIIRLTNQGTKPIKVLSITSSAPTVTADTQPVSDGKEYKITVALHSGTPDGQVHGDLQIKTDDPNQQVVRVPFYGIVGQFQI